MRSRTELFIPVSSLSIARYPKAFQKALEVEPAVFWSDDRSEAIVEGQGGDYQLQVRLPGRPERADVLPHLRGFARCRRHGQHGIAAGRIKRGLWKVSSALARAPVSTTRVSGCASCITERIPLTHL